MQQVNYIRQLSSVNEKFMEDDRLSPWHISMYYALFHFWNLSKFRNPISINREDLMTASKIGSNNTYSKCIKELSKWGYIEYQPSKNPMRGSKVHMYIFDTCTDTSTETSSDLSPDTSIEHQPIHLLRPSINRENNRNNETIKTNKRGKTFSPPGLEEVKGFFKESESTHDEAESFFNHFQSNGWLVGGKAKMKDWQAAARNWIKRSKTFTKGNGGHRSSSGAEMSAPNNTNYEIPL